MPSRIVADAGTPIVDVPLMSSTIPR
jgi:hypothetical protein